MIQTSGPHKHLPFLLIIAVLAIGGLVAVYQLTISSEPSAIPSAIIEKTITTPPETKQTATDNSIVNYFRYVASDWRTVQKSSANRLQNLRQYGSNKPLSYQLNSGSEVSIATFNIVDDLTPLPPNEDVPRPDSPTTNVNNDIQPMSGTRTRNYKGVVETVPKANAEAITADQWQRELPSGTMYVDVDWYCSSMSFNLYLQNGLATSTEPFFGMFHGDCTNPEVIVQGKFNPQKVGPVEANYLPTWHFQTSYYRGGDYSLLSSDPEECDIKYYRHAGARGVYAAQYTCEDGLQIGLRDDIQFTAYIFTADWQEGSDTEKLLSEFDLDSDGDSLTNQREVELGTDPNNADTDGDGRSDSSEVKLGSDPLQRPSTEPTLPNPTNKDPVNIPEPLVTE